MTLSNNIYWLIVYISIAWVIRVLMVPTVLRRQLAPGAAVAWLGIVFLHPYIGLALFLTLGETRLGASRVARHRKAVLRYRPGVIDHSQQPKHADLSLPHEAMILQAEKISGLPVLAGNAVEFLPSAPAFVQRLIADIDAAKSQVHLLYYIIVADATGEAVMSAVERAAARGVKCRVLADAVASRAFFHHNGLARRLTAAGVHVLVYRGESPLYVHAKAVLVDGGLPGQRAFVGSQNFSTASMRYNRELGIVTADPAVLARLGTVLAADARGGTPWT